MTSRKYGNEETVPPHVMFARLMRAEVEIQRKRAKSGKRIQWDKLDELLDGMIAYMPEDEKRPQ